MKAENMDQWLSEIDLASVVAMLSHKGATEILYKLLPRNANSKNQVYLASDLSQLSRVPSGDVTAHQSTSSKNGKQEAVFRSALEFYWLGHDGQPSLAPNAQLIFYPQYPEVRFSGFLKGCRNAPSSLWVKEKRGEVPDRILVLGVGNGRKIFALTLPPESPAAKEIRLTGPHPEYGALFVLPVLGQPQDDGFADLIRELCGIHRRLWVPSTRLASDGTMVPCKGQNCHGNTLESLLGIRSNGYSLPDYRGWEVKARQVADIASPGSSTVTLFTPEPTSGFYIENGVGDFVRRYGYADKRGRDDRLNFGGIYRAGAAAHKTTGVRLVLDGYDTVTRKYRADGSIKLLDRHDAVAAAWSFSKLMDHWKAKHSRAAFVPSERREAPDLQYRFGRQILLGEGADFGLFLEAVERGQVYYDPGVKLEAASSPTPKAKKRSQFRIASKNLPLIYERTRTVDTCDRTENCGKHLSEGMVVQLLGQ